MLQVRRLAGIAGAVDAKKLAKKEAPAARRTIRSAARPAFFQAVPRMCPRLLYFGIVEKIAMQVGHRHLALADSDRSGIRASG